MESPNSNPHHYYRVHNLIPLTMQYYRPITEGETPEEYEAEKKAFQQFLSNTESVRLRRTDLDAGSPFRWRRTDHHAPSSAPRSAPVVEPLQSKSVGPGSDHAAKSSDRSAPSTTPS